jgi:hypothetical protein
MRRFHFLVLLLIITATTASSQHVVTPLNKVTSLRYEPKLYLNSATNHTLLKPFFYTKPSKSILRDTAATRWKKVKHHLLNNDLVRYDSSDYDIVINPLLNGELALDIETKKKYYLNSRGLVVSGTIGSRFRFQTSFVESQAIASPHIARLIQQRGVYPGLGRVKKFKTEGYDFAIASGSFYGMVSKNFFIKAGTDKHFVGDGYRSLFLSDNAFNYPFISANYQTGNWLYMYMVSSHMILNEPKIKPSKGAEGYFKKKTASCHLLNYNFNETFSIGLFQSTMWDLFTNEHPKFDFGVLDPVPLSNAFRYGLDSRNNVAVGTNFKVTIPEYCIIYGQFLLDEAGAGKFEKNGYQVGVKNYNVFELEGLFMLAEYNHTNPYLYTSTRSSQSYTHYNEPLGHPAGAGFNEIVMIADYQLERLTLDFKVIAFKYNYGRTGVNVLDPVNVNTKPYARLDNSAYLFDGFVAYDINSSYHLQAFAGLQLYKRVLGNTNERMINFGIRTALYNSYRDYF